VAKTYLEYKLEHRRRQNKGAIGKDSEQGKVYASEWAIRSLLQPESSKFENVRDAQKFVDRVMKSKTWEKVRQNNRKRVPVVAMRDRSGGVNALCEWSGEIKCKPSHMYKYVIIHELAHAAGHMHHGRSFRQCLLKLTSQFLGRDKADALKAQFKKRNLPFGDARKPLTEAQWNARRDRLCSSI